MTKIMKNSQNILTKKSKKQKQEEFYLIIHKGHYMYYSEIYLNKVGINIIARDRERINSKE